MRIPILIPVLALVLLAGTNDATADPAVQETPRRALEVAAQPERAAPRERATGLATGKRQHKAIAERPIRTGKIYADPRRLSSGIAWNPDYDCFGDDSGLIGCDCDGVLDCKALLDSGLCGDDAAWWQDPEDPAQGGCDIQE